MPRGRGDLTSYFKLESLFTKILVGFFSKKPKIDKENEKPENGTEQKAGSSKGASASTADEIMEIDDEPQSSSAGAAR